MTHVPLTMPCCIISYNSQFFFVVFLFHCSGLTYWLAQMIGVVHFIAFLFCMGRRTSDWVTLALAATILFMHLLIHSLLAREKEQCMRLEFLTRVRVNQESVRIENILLSNLPEKWVRRLKDDNKVETGVEMFEEVSTASL